MLLDRLNRLEGVRLPQVGGGHYSPPGYGAALSRAAMNMRGVGGISGIGYGHLGGMGKPVKAGGGGAGRRAKGNKAVAAAGAAAGVKKQQNNKKKNNKKKATTVKKEGDDDKVNELGEKLKKKLTVGGGEAEEDSEANG